MSIFEAHIVILWLVWTSVARLVLAGQLIANTSYKVYVWNWTETNRSSKMTDDLTLGLDSKSINIIGESVFRLYSREPKSLWLPHYFVTKLVN
jgi:hypothetical protein